MKAILQLPQPVDPEGFGEAFVAKAKADKWPVYESDPRYVVCPKGTTLEGPDVWRLVRAGSCKPGDEECRAAAGMTDKQIAEHYKVYRAKEKGQLFGDDRDRTEIVKA